MNKKNKPVLRSSQMKNFNSLQLLASDHGTTITSLRNVLDFRGADFTDANLENAKFTGANTKGVIGLPP
jgi:uncharacterized protein YjbI with pentapeptide repeats